MNYYPQQLTYQDIAPFDAEFTAQLQSKTSLFPQQVINQIAGIWETDKLNIINSVRAKAGAGFNRSIIQQAVYNFISRMYTMCTSGGMNGGYGAIGMGGGMMGNPFAATGVPTTGYRTPMSMMGGPAQFQPVASNIVNPMQPSTNTSMIYDIPQPANNGAVAAAQAEQQVAPEEKNVLHIIKENKPVFNKPISDDPDEVFGSEVHETSIGNFRITSMLDENGQRFKYVDMRLYECCRSDFSVLERAHLLYNAPVGVGYHIDITYKKVGKIDVPYDKFSNIIGQMRSAIGRATRAKNKLNYLKSVAKILNAECRGVANAIESFLMDEFLKVARFGCVSSDVPESVEFGVRSIMDLIELADKDTANMVAQGWQKTDGFCDRLVEIVNATIRNIIMNCTILDLNDQNDIGKILRTYAGNSVDPETGDVVDVLAELYDKRIEYAKASIDDKRSLFGTAGKIVADSSVIIIPDQHMTLTTFTPQASLGIKDGYPVAFVNRNYIGGVDDKGNPNPIDSTFEYLMLNMTLTDGDYTKVAVMFSESIYGFYDCVGTTDKWYQLIPTSLKH